MRTRAMEIMERWSSRAAYGASRRTIVCRAARNQTARLVGPPNWGSRLPRWCSRSGRPGQPQRAVGGGLEGVSLLPGAKRGMTTVYELKGREGGVPGRQMGAVEERSARELRRSARASRGAGDGAGGCGGAARWWLCTCSVVRPASFGGLPGRRYDGGRPKDSLAGSVCKNLRVGCV
jgi:hypothetical protein